MPQDILVIGAGMIVRDQILPSLYQLQRLGKLGRIRICVRNAESARRLLNAEDLQRAFPGQKFETVVGPFGEAIAAAENWQIVFVALPDQLHYGAVMEAIEHNQHVCCVKPLALSSSHGEEIAEEARKRGLVVAIDYHKRFDDRSLMARRAYRQGRFGEFKLGSACLLEKWFYRRSNFQNWMTAAHTDAFTYIGCHYVDLVHFITGLQPVAVSVYGVPGKFPNGAEAYLWTDARIIWNNGACLNVQNALGYPDAAPGSNTQDLTLYCEGGSDGGLISHSDQYRGLKYSYAEPPTYSEPSPDYFQYVDYGGPGLTPVGYGFRSIEQMIAAIARVEAREAAPADIDASLVATAANSAFNDGVIEAARQSILEAGRQIKIG